MAADQATREARESPNTDRVAILAAAGRACRVLPGDQVPSDVGCSAVGEIDLTESVACELAAATAKLPERQREALVLRELLTLSHDEISMVMGIEAAAVAPLLARARLLLAAERRGTGSERHECAERDRALRALARRHDRERLSANDDAWLLAHLAGCAECDRAHALMIEASACYRAWRVAAAAPNGASPELRPDASDVRALG